MTKTTSLPAHRTNLTVRVDPSNPKRWCIFNLYLDRVEQGGFFHYRHADEYLERNYNLSRV